MFRTYAYTFTTDEAAKVMSSLVFIHVHRNPDPTDPSRLIATRTTTTFSMDYATAKNLLQQFLSARLIMSATDATNWAVKDRGLWCPTIKGKYVLEEFTEDTQVDMSDTLMTALNSAPYMSIGSSNGGRLITLDRLIDNDDQITFSRPNMTATFKAMMTSLPRDALMVDEFSGIEKNRLSMFQYTFVGMLCIEWLCNRLTIACREEAENVASEFVLFGWIAQVLDKADKRHHAKPNQHNNSMSFFKTDRDAIYYVTERGCIIMGWKAPPNCIQNDSNQSVLSVDSDSSNSTDKILKRGGMKPPAGIQQTTLGSQSELLPRYEVDMARQDSLIMAASSTSSSDISNETVVVPLPSPTPSLVEQQQQQQQRRPILIRSQRPPSMSITDSSVSSTMKDNSQWTRLTQILGTPLLRMYFRDFLRTNYCVENMDFWVDHHKLLCKSNEAVLDQIAACYAMYETYLCSRATADVNIDHALHQQIITYVTSVFVVINQPPPTTSVAHFFSPATSTLTVPSQPKTSLLLVPPQATKQRVVTLRSISPEQCLDTLLEMLSRVNDHVCRMMAEDSVPKFIKTDKYKELIAQQQQRKVQDEQENGEDYEDSSDDQDLIRMTTALSAQKISMDHQRHVTAAAAAATTTTTSTATVI
jgi:hypothetical protein